MKVQRYVKETVGMMLLFIIIGSTMTVQAKEYEDVPPEHWAYNAIENITSKGILQPSTNKFEPEKFITRLEASEAIGSLIEGTQSDIKLNFKDITEQTPQYEAIRRLVAIGALQNTIQFNGGSNLRRSHMAKMITMVAGIPYQTPHYITSKDVLPQNWDYNYIGAVTSSNIMNGVNKDYFYPERYVTRAQLAVIIERTINYKETINYDVVYDYLHKATLQTKNYSRDWSIEIARLTNEFRAQYNLEPLKYDRLLEQIAIIKVNDMIKGNYFEHYSPDYGQPWDLATIFDYKFVGYGENIARHFKTPKHTILGWMNSPGHRKNMLNEQYTHIGVAVEKDAEGNFYWVQHFASK